MLSESAARDLLVQAGETIDVPPGMPELPPAPPRRWLPVLAAAAAVLAVIGAGAVLLGTGSKESPTPPAGETALDDGQVPSVFSYDGQSARTLLESRGYVVQTKVELSCADADRALRTEPAVGTRVGPGSTVVLVVSSMGTRRCPPPLDQEAWEFLDFANGRGPAPRFSPRVDLYFDGIHTGTLTADQAVDPSTWGVRSALSELRDASGSVLEVPTASGPEFLTASLTTEWSTGPWCGAPVPALTLRTAFVMSVGIDVGVKHDCPVTVALYRDASGRVDAVSAYTRKAPGSLDRGAVPDLIGLTGGQALLLLEENGLTGKLIPAPGTKLCIGRTPSVVGRQEPTPGSVLPAGSQVTLAMRWVPCGEASTAP
jgi:hypothetical protein